MKGKLTVFMLAGFGTMLAVIFLGLHDSEAKTVALGGLCGLSLGLPFLIPILVGITVATLKAFGVLPPAPAAAPRPVEKVIIRAPERIVVKCQHGVPLEVGDCRLCNGRTGYYLPPGDVPRLHD